MHIVVTFRDRILSDYANRLEHLAGGGLGILEQALYEGGHAVRAMTVAAETAQTGLQQDTLERAQHEQLGSLSYTIMSEGGNVRLKYFGAKESGGGVTAHPWNTGHYYSGAFINSGWGGNRAPSPKLGGQVYQRAGRSRLPIAQKRSGLFIPTEMVRGQTAGAFNRGAATVLATTVLSRLGSLLP